MRHLYRFFDADDILLYVGITHHLPSRLVQHSASKPWWVSVATVKVEHFLTLNEAVTAEREAIIAERPRFNIDHNKPPRTPKRRVKYKRPTVKRVIEPISLVQTLKFDICARCGLENAPINLNDNPGGGCSCPIEL